MKAYSQSMNSTAFVPMVIALLFSVVSAACLGSIGLYSTLGSVKAVVAFSDGNVTASICGLAAFYVLLFCLANRAVLMFFKTMRGDNLQPSLIDKVFRFLRNRETAKTSIGVQTWFGCRMNALSSEERKILRVWIEHGFDDTRAAQALEVMLSSAKFTDFRKRIVAHLESAVYAASQNGAKGASGAE